MGAVTDSYANVHFDPENQPGVSNLMQILSSLSNDRPIGEIEQEFQGKGYGEFKRAVADAVCARLEQIQARYDEIITSDMIATTLSDGARRASLLANAKLEKVQKAIGMEIIA